MSKPDKNVLEPDTISDKLRDSLTMEDNKPDSVNADLGSPITPLQTGPSGLTSAATTTTTSSCSSSSSGSVTGRAGNTPVTRKPDSARPNPSAAQSSKSSTSSAAQSTSSNLAGAQLKSSSTSAAQSSKSTAQSGSAAAQASKSTAQSGTAVAQSSKSTAPSAAQSKPSISSAAKSSKSSTPFAAQSKSSSTSAAQSGSTSPAGAQSGSSSQAGAKNGSSSNSPKTATGNVRPGRGSATSDSASGTAKQSGKSSTAPPPQPVKIVPAGNLFPSGKVQITGMTQGIPRSMVLGPGAKSYGYGSIMRGSTLSPTKPTSSSPSSSGSPVNAGSSSCGQDAETLWKKAMTSSNPEEVKRVGNELFKKGCFAEALKLYDRAVELSPTNAAYHSNRAAALSGLGRIGEAVIECEEAIKLEPTFARAHHRLATLLLR